MIKRTLIICCCFLAYPTLWGNENKVPKNIFKAAEQGNIEAIKQFLKLGVDINSQKGKSLKTPLHYACGSLMIEGEEKLNVVQFLLEQGADPNKKDIYGLTPLAGEGLRTSNLFNLLTSNGATVDKTDKKAEYYLRGAIWGEGSTQIKYLVENCGLDPLQLNEVDGDRFDDKKRNLLNHAVKVGNEDAFFYLLHKKVPLLQKNELLISAFKRRLLRIVHYLVKHGALSPLSKEPKESPLSIVFNKISYRSNPLGITFEAIEKSFSILRLLINKSKCIVLKGEYSTKNVFLTAIFPFRPNLFLPDFLIYCFLSHDQRNGFSIKKSVITEFSSKPLLKTLPLLSLETPFWQEQLKKFLPKYNINVTIFLKLVQAYLVATFTEGHFPSELLYLDHDVLALCRKLCESRELYGRMPFDYWAELEDPTITGYKNFLGNLKQFVKQQGNTFCFPDKQVLEKWHCDCCINFVPQPLQTFKKLKN